MKDGPSIAGIAALIGDHARAEILTALMAGRALTATELAAVAGVTKQTVSTHLGKLLDSNLLSVESQGRHRYFRLANRDVANLLENLMGLAFRIGAVRVRSSPREPALRKARVCYDHLAGELGVLVYEGLVRQRALRFDAGALTLTERGNELFHGLGIDIDELSRHKRAFCRACLDWSERRHHLAGAVGAALLERIVALRWATPARDSRVVTFSANGERALRRAFGIDAAQAAQQVPS
jgi:DNA-binding transcriptional ArsR family regulator